VELASRPHLRNGQRKRLISLLKTKIKKNLKQIKYLLMGIAGSMAIGFFFWALVFGGFFAE
jgi:hypothetical protein